MPVSALPSEEGIGTLGKGAYDFVDFLAASSFSVWQVLPLTPTLDGNSPYSSVAAFALNPLYIDLAELTEEGLLTSEELPAKKSGKIDYPSVKREKDRLLRLAFSRFDKRNEEFISFEREGAYRDYAAFSSLGEYFGGKAFYDWGDGYSSYDPIRTKAFLSAHEDSYLYYVFTQYLFSKQWKRLKTYANGKGIRILGDLPIYLSRNSVEMYAHSELFMLGEDGAPALVAGVPPDYFNEEGQLWGNPLYDWERMKADGYSWWRERIRRELSLFDILRIDHFRGLDRFYAIDASAPNAKEGKWLPGPGAALFEGFEDAPIVAEDLGYIDDSLREMLKKVGYPGMKVYEFGLNGDPWSEHKPANYRENVVAYTGTHDNMPFKGYLDGLKGEEKKTAIRDIKTQAEVLSVPLRLQNNAMLTRTAVETLFASKARLAICPMQDLLSLGAEARMNTPALVSEENWAWRLDRGAIKESLIRSLSKMLKATDRANKEKEAAL